MRITLIVTRPDMAITLADWTKLVDEDDNLRLRVQPYVASNPGTGERISIKAGEADAEIFIDGQWLSFLRFRDGDLMMKYVQEFDDMRNATRIKIAAIARELGASIGTDAGDEFLNW